jgi:hypothetical protein
LATSPSCPTATTTSLGTEQEAFQILTQHARPAPRRGNAAQDFRESRPRDGGVRFLERADVHSARFEEEPDLLARAVSSEQELEIAASRHEDDPRIQAGLPRRLPPAAVRSKRSAPASSTRPSSGTIMSGDTLRWSTLGGFLPATLLQRHGVHDRRRHVLVEMCMRRAFAFDASLLDAAQVLGFADGFHLRARP